MDGEYTDPTQTDPSSPNSLWDQALGYIDGFSTTVTNVAKAVAAVSGKPIDTTTNLTQQQLQQKTGQMVIPQNQQTSFFEQNKSVLMIAGGILIVVIAVVLLKRK